jgi:hypothetical protein
MTRTTFKERALALLCERVQENATGETIGRPYDEIDATLKQEFPQHKWDFNIALRWYAHKVRDGEFDGYELPDRRPPARWTQRKKEQ